MKVYIKAGSEIRSIDQFIRSWSGAVSNIRPAFNKLKRLIDSRLPDADSVEWYFSDADRPEFSVLVETGLESEDDVVECIETSAKSCGFAISWISSDRYHVSADFSFSKYV